MESLYILNTIVWFSVVLGIMWATHSKHVCDGVCLKVAMAAMAFGALANGIKPTFHSQLWIGMSLAIAVLCFVGRICYARLKNQKPVFLVFDTAHSGGGYVARDSETIHRHSRVKGRQT